MVVVIPRVADGVLSLAIALEIKGVAGLLVNCL